MPFREVELPVFVGHGINLSSHNGHDAYDRGSRSAAVADGGEGDDSLAIARLAQDSAKAAVRIFDEVAVSTTDVVAASRQITTRLQGYAQAVIQRMRQEKVLSQAQTTLVGGVVIGNDVIVASYGDSKAYLVRDGKARQLNQQESPKNIGLISTPPSVTTTRVRDGDWVVFTSDGVPDHMGLKRVTDILSQAHNVHEAAAALQNEVVRHARKYQFYGDDVTIVILKIGISASTARSLWRLGRGLNIELPEYLITREHFVNAGLTVFSRNFSGQIVSVRINPTSTVDCHSGLPISGSQRFTPASYGPALQRLQSQGVPERVVGKIGEELGSIRGVDRVSFYPHIVSPEPPLIAGSRPD